MIRRTTAALALLALGCAAFADKCPGAICDSGFQISWTGQCSLIDCNTYSEAPVIEPTKGTPVPHTEVLGKTFLDNCGSSTTLTGKKTLSWTYSESITHSCGGGMTSTVGAQLGSDAVGKLSLGHSFTASNGWQKVDTWTQSHTEEINYSVAPCSKAWYTVTGTWYDGSFSKHGYISWSAQVRGSCFDPWVSGAGDCDDTTSNASGFNKNYVNIQITHKDAKCTCSTACTGTGTGGVGGVGSPD